MDSDISIAFVTASVLFALSTLLLGLKSVYGKDWSQRTDITAVLCTLALGLLLAQLYHQSPISVILGAFILLFTLVVGLQLWFKDYTAVGLAFYCSNLLLSVIGLVWGYFFLLLLDISPVTRALLLIMFPLLFITLPFGLLQMIEQFDVLCRKRWSRPRVPLRRHHSKFRPMVSIHVPVYAEPPDIVISTLNKINVLRYENYEVIVVDNNTKDETLWRPVQEHCEKLGEKFRFFHVSPLQGAKAGALNFALAHTSASAEIIGVIDSDYHTHPDFIRDLIDYFEDPNVGFVQTPHDYRGWERSTYLTMCYWEYKAFFHTIQVALNERDAALTSGTMCLLRKKAIEDAGGWATWCLTEDSEIAIRIHNRGYSSVYLPHSYGKGLIPETFGDYAGQRFRWIAGPVQELKHHAAQLLGFGPHGSRLSLSQRLHHLHHGFVSSMFGLTIPVIILSILLAISMVAHNEVIPVPYPLWLSVTVLFLSNAFLHWLQYRVVLRSSFKGMLLALLAHKSLSHAMNFAALTAMVRGTQEWRRTNKFKRSQTLVTSLLSTRYEISIGLSLCGTAVLFYWLQPFPGLLTMCILGLLYKSIDHLAAPVVSVIAALSLRA